MKNISKQVLALAATTMLGFGAIQGAVAGDGYYVKGEVGVAMPKKIDDVKFKKSAIFGIEGGYKMNENFRFGLGIGLINNIKPKDVDPDIKAKINSLILETNAYYDIADFNGFTPYLTAGVGVSRNKLKITDSSSNSSGSMEGNPIATGKTGGNDFKGSGDSSAPNTQSGSSSTSQSVSFKKTGFAWNVGLGAMYNINSEFGVDLAYRYRDLGKVKINDTDSKKLKSHNVTVGVVYKF
jgi:opacity protein-like surface antigen